MNRFLVYSITLNDYIDRIHREPERILVIKLSTALTEKGFQPWRIRDWIISQ